jgi:hypothetical protein
MKTVAKLTLLPWFENKKGNYSGRCFYHSDPGHAKSDKY